MSINKQKIIADLTLLTAQGQVNDIANVLPLTMDFLSDYYGVSSIAGLIMTGFKYEPTLFSAHTDIMALLAQIKLSTDACNALLFTYLVKCRYCRFTWDAISIRYAGESSIQWRNRIANALNHVIGYNVSSCIPNIDDNENALDIETKMDIMDSILTLLDGIMSPTDYGNLGLYNF